MAGPIISKLLTDFFNEIGQEATLSTPQFTAVDWPQASTRRSCSIFKRVSSLAEPSDQVQV